MSGASSEPDTPEDTKATEQEGLSANSRRKRRGRNSGWTQVSGCALNQVPAVTQSKGTAWFPSLLLKTVLSSWIPSPASPGGGRREGPPARLQELLLWLLASLGGIQTRVPHAHLQGQGTNWWALLNLVSEEAAPAQSHPGALPSASPPPKTPINASKSPQGLGN